VVPDTNGNAAGFAQLERSIRDRDVVVVEFSPFLQCVASWVCQTSLGVMLRIGKTFLESCVRHLAKEGLGAGEAREHPRQVAKGPEVQPFPANGGLVVAATDLQVNDEKVLQSTMKESLDGTHHGYSKSCSHRRLSAT
jgi:hypothetical protein